MFSESGLKAELIIVPQASGKNDPIRAVLTELVGPPTLSTTDELRDARDRAVTLELTNRFAQVKGVQTTSHLPRVI